MFSSLDHNCFIVLKSISLPTVAAVHLLAASEWSWLATEKLRIHQVIGPGQLLNTLLNRYFLGFGMRPGVQVLGDLSSVAIRPATILSPTQRRLADHGCCSHPKSVLPFASQSPGCMDSIWVEMDESELGRCFKMNIGIRK